VRSASTLRISAAVAFALLIAYELMRIAAESCVGEACDAFIPLSLLLPVAILVAAGVTGALAIAAARPAGGAWLMILVAVSVLSVVGPLLALAVFRDQPDALVPAASVLFVLTPVAALIYTLRKSSPPIR
jgi:hypothetical protein